MIKKFDNFLNELNRETYANLKNYGLRREDPRGTRLGKLADERADRVYGKILNFKLPNDNVIYHMKIKPGELLTNSKMKFEVIDNTHNDEDSSSPFYSGGKKAKFIRLDKVEGPMLSLIMLSNLGENCFTDRIGAKWFANEASRLFGNEVKPSQIPQF